MALNFRFQCLGGHLTSNDFQKACENLSVEANINGALIARALMHNKETAFRDYLTSVNPALSCKFILPTWLLTVSWYRLIGESKNDSVEIN